MNNRQQMIHYFDKWSQNKTSYCCSKEDLKALQSEFLSKIGFSETIRIKLYNERDSNYNMVDYQIQTKSHLSKIDCVSKRVFDIVYTKPHFVEFLDDCKIIHFVYL